MLCESPAEWSYTTLGECATWYSGGTPDTGNPEYWGGSIPWITASSLHDFYIKTSERRVTPLGLKNGTRLVPKDSILFVVRGMSLKTDFRIGIARRDVAFGQDCKALIPLERVNPLFLANVLRAKKKEILSLVDEASHGTGRLETNTLKQLEVPLPPLKEQEKIASTFEALDDKIELNRQMNETLEAMAQALFKSWFVDFEPVKANAEDRPLPGLDHSLQALFPASFEPSPLGEIPLGWQTRPLDDIADFLNGLACQKYPPKDEADFLPVIKIAELRQGVTEKSDKASPHIDLKYIIGDGDIIFSWSGSLVVCIWCGGQGALNQHLFKVTSEKYPKWFYYFWVKHFLPEFQDIAASKATTMGHIKRHHLTDSLTLCPSPDLLSSMNSIMEPLLNRIVHNDLESRTLTQLRDTLLPKLLSGKIRLIDVEAKVEALC